MFCELAPWLVILPHVASMCFGGAWAQLPKNQQMHTFRYINYIYIHIYRVVYDVLVLFVGSKLALKPEALETAIPQHRPTY